MAPELDPQGPDALRAYRRVLLSRLLAGEAHAVPSGARDLHDAVLLAAVGARLGAAGEPTAGDRLDAARAAWVVHQAGHAWEATGALRAEVDQLGEVAADPASRRLFADLAASARGLAGVGRRWFPGALHAALADGDEGGELDRLRGRWLLAEGRAAEASEALLEAVEARATVPRMLDLARALWAAGRDAEARHLSARLRVRAPGLAATLDGLARDEADRRATAAYEARSAAATVEERAAQAWRYERLGRSAEAAGLVEGLLRDAPDRREARHVAAELWLRWGRLGRLEALLDEAGRAGALDRRLREARVAAVLTARLGAAAGEEAGALAARPLEEDLAALGLDPEAAWALRALHVATATPPDAEALGAALAAAPRASADALTLAAAAWLSLGAPERAMRAVLAGGAGATGEEAARIGLLLGGLEVTYGAGRGDRGLLARGRERLERVGGLGAPADRALAAYHRAVGAWAAARGAEAGPEGARALEALLGLADRLDPTTGPGRAALEAVGVSAAGLATAEGRAEVAGPALDLVRRVAPRGVWGRLAAGLVALAAEDLPGALDALAEAAEAAREPALRFAVHKWRALAANRAARPAEMVAELAAMLALWDAAGAAERKAGRRPRAVVAGEVALGVALPEGAPLRLEVGVTPLAVLVPDFPHDRAEVRALGGAGGP